jgi:hypothetical protein
MFSGNTLGLSFARLGSAAGIGALTGSFFSGRLLSAGVKPTTIFRVASLLALCQGGIDLVCLKETLPKEKRSKKPLTFPNPLAGARLFNGSRGLKTLVTVAVLQCMPEGKNISDALSVRTLTSLSLFSVFLPGLCFTPSPFASCAISLMSVVLMHTRTQTYHTNDIGMTPVDAANFITAFGSSMMFGGALAKHSISLFGDRGHTTFSNVLTVLAMLVWGSSSRKSAAWLGLFILFPTMERRCVTSAQATDLAVSEGWEKVSLL